MRLFGVVQSKTRHLRKFAFFRRRNQIYSLETHACLIRAPVIWRGRLAKRSAGQRDVSHSVPTNFEAFACREVRWGMLAERAYWEILFHFQLTLSRSDFSFECIIQILNEIRLTQPRSVLLAVDFLELSRSNQTTGYVSAISTVQGYSLYNKLRYKLELRESHLKETSQHLKSRQKRISGDSLQLL